MMKRWVTLKVTKKLFVFSLIWFLLFLSVAVVVKPVHADNWTDITLPYTITQSGNYRITQPWTGSGIGLTIDASNVVVDGQNNLLQLTNQGPGNYGIQISPGSLNAVLENINETGGNVGLWAEYASSFTVQYSNLTNNLNAGLDAYSASNFTVQYSNLNNNNYVGLYANSATNYTVQYSSLNNNNFDGLFGYSGSNFSVQYSSLSNNHYYGMSAYSARNYTVQYSSLNNNFYKGLYAYYADNGTINGNIFSGNGLSRGPYDGGIENTDSNCTVTNNVFDSNYDGLLWGAYDHTINNMQVYSNNIFKNNSYTFHFDYELPTTYTNQKLLFYNNLVNDSAYVDPDSFSSACSGPYMPFNSAVLNLNTTLQSGTRIYNSGSMIGGNFWAYPNGTGYSQIGDDVNHDGFVDTPFDLFGDGTIYDYLPYSSSYMPSLVYTAGSGQSLAAGQISSLVTVQLQDSFGSLTSGVTFTLSSTSSTGGFYSNQAGTNEISSITILAGSSLGSFYYKDTAAGTPTLTVLSQGVASAITEFTITSHTSAVDHITISPPTATIAAGASQSYSATAYDQYGNSWNVTPSTSWSISSGAGGSWSGNVYTSANAGTWTITGVYDSMSYTTTLTVNPSALDHFAVTFPSSKTLGNSVSVMITAKDAFGNTVTSFTGKVSLYASLGFISPWTSDSLAEGVWIGFVTLTSTGSITITATDGNGHSGTSSAITISAPSPSPTPTTAPTSTPTPTPIPSQIPTPTSSPNSNPTDSASQTPTLLITLAVIIAVIIALAIIVVCRQKRNNKWFSL